MELKVKFLKLTAGIPLVMLNSHTAEDMGLRATDRVSLETFSNPPKQISTIINLVDKIVAKDEVGISDEIRKRLNLKHGQKVDISFLPPSKSLVLIKKKLNGKILSENEVNEIIKDVSNNSLSEPEIALFVSAMYEKGMNMKEIIYLIKAILKTGEVMKLSDKYVVDKHSVGGVPGNRTTPLVIPICAAAGLIFPKTSSRAITSAAGTADVIETIADVEFNMADLKKIIKKTGACIVWGGSLKIVPADNKIIKIEKILNIDPEAQLIASIMSKKLAVGSKYILIDIPYGKTAKLSKKHAEALEKKFEYLGRYFKKKLKCLITDGSQPIGNGIGPALELMDIIKILENKKGPKDLQDKALLQAGTIFEMTGKAKHGKGIEMAREILYSGKAYEKFKEIIKAQNGNLKKLKIGKFTEGIHSKKGGKVAEIDNKLISALARMAGCPIDKGSGIYLHKHVGDKVKKGEKIMTLYAESKHRLNEAALFAHSHNPYGIK
ncbi:MAG: AMP phosphorylase [Candidatus Pacearchaeota archaeon]